MATDEDEDLRQIMRMPAYRMPGREGDRLRAAVMEGFATRYPGPARYDATGRMETGVVAVRSYPRREADGGVHQVRAHDRAAPPAQGRAPAAARGQAPGERPEAQRPARPADSVPRAWEGQVNQAWREQIAGEEVRGRMATAHGYDVVGDTNPLAWGRYQMTPDALRGARWQTGSGEWTERARRAGVTDRASFLANPVAQEPAFDDYLRDNKRQLRANGAIAFIGRPLRGFDGQIIVVTMSGLAAAAHREGPRKVLEYLQHIERGLPRPPAVSGRGNRSKFNEVERRLRAFANQDYISMLP